MRLLWPLLLLVACSAQAQFGFVRQRWLDNGRECQLVGFLKQRWNQVGEFPTNLTVVGYSGHTRARCDGELSRIEIWHAGNETVTLKLCSLQTDSVTVEQQRSVALTSGTNVISTNWRVAHGDALGIYSPTIGATYGYNPNDPPGAGACRVAWKLCEDARDTWTPDGSGSAGHALTIGGWGSPGPAYGILADSIVLGYPFYCGHLDEQALDSGIGGHTTNSVAGNAALVWNLQGRYINYGAANRGMDWADDTAMLVITNDQPMALLLAIGANDLAEGRPWSQVLARLDSIRAKWPRSKPLLIAELLPDSRSDDIEACTFRSWNTNLSLWCSQQSAVLLPVHDDFGTNRPSTGYLDDLKPEYAYEQDHLNPAGLERYAWHVARALRRWIK